MQALEEVEASAASIALKAGELGHIVNLREETPHCAAQQDNVISRVDLARERGFVPVEVVEDCLKEARGCTIC